MKKEQNMLEKNSLNNMKNLLNLFNMKQLFIERVKKNEKLPKNMSEVYRSLGYMNYKKNKINSHISYYKDICLISKSLNGHEWNPEFNDNEKNDIFFPYFEWNIHYKKFIFYSFYYNENSQYYGNLSLGFKTKELAEYAGRTFEKEYNKWLTTEYESKLIEEVYYRDIKTMSDVYRVNGITKLTTLPDTKERYYEDLILIAKALNENWKPNWIDFLQEKHMPVFIFDLNFKFKSSFSEDEYISIDIGPHICFIDSKRAEYAAQNFSEQYNKFINFV
jgi:hypothetical protein